MNIFKKLITKKKIKEVIKTDIIKPELITLSRFTDKKDFIRITNLCVFDKSHLEDFMEVVSTNKLRLSMKERDNMIYVYFILNDIKGFINNLSSDNPFFSVFKELIYYSPYKESYYDEGLIDNLNSLSINNIKQVDLINVIKEDLIKMNNNIFIFRDLSTVICIYDKVSLYDVLTNEDLSFEISIKDFYNIYGANTIKSMITKKYEKSYKDLDIDNLISEVIDEELVISEDEDGNLIYDKTQFE